MNHTSGRKTWAVGTATISLAIIRQVWATISLAQRQGEPPLSYRAIALRAGYSLNNLGMIGAALAVLHDQGYISMRPGLSRAYYVRVLLYERRRCP